jgi:CelD/BcsL family acetyltransferase involved in cellulose biosynthesis
MAFPSKPLAAGEPTRSRGTGLVEMPISDPRWERFVASHPETFVFHRPAWSRAIVDCYGFRPFALTSQNADGEIDAGIPMFEVRTPFRPPRWVALPFSDICRPLLGDEVSLADFTQGLEDARVRAGVASLEVRAPLAENRAAHGRSDAVIHTTLLDRDPDRVFERLHRSQVQRNIRRAQREARVTVYRGESASDLTRTYYDLHVRTRCRQGMPVQPRRFFEAIWTHLLERDDGYVLLARVGRTPIAGAVFLAGTRTMTYKFGASDDAAWRLRPNHLLIWSALQSACEEGYDRLDFGRSDLSGQGLRAFKSGWGAVEEPLVHTTVGRRPSDPGSGRARAVMSALIRHTPAWTSRTIGEMLYRYTA